MKGRTLLVVLLILVCILPVQAAIDQSKIPPTERYIVTYPEGKAAMRATNVQNNAIQKTADLPIINGFAITSKDDIQSLERMYPGATIQPDRIFYIHKSIQLGTSVPSIGATTVNASGLNVTVAIIDTGIDYTHADLGGCYGPSCKVAGGYDFYNGDTNPIDDNGHGTHIAGTVASNGTTKGVAPNATLYALKVCNNNGSCPESLMIQAIQWARDNNIDILSMSIGGSMSINTTGNTGLDVVSSAVDNATLEGVVTVLSAGNDGPGTSTIGSPAASKYAITVANAYDGGSTTQADDYIVSGSSRGPVGFGRLKPDISAPGTGICAAKSTVCNLQGGACSSTCGDANHISISGTSMATPHVAGAAALLLEKHPEYTPSQVKAILTQHAYNVTGKIFEKGSGEVNIQQAIDANTYALVRAKNSKQEYETTDKWEFVANIWTTTSANVTIINNNNFSINFSASIDSTYNLENSETLNNNQFSIPDIQVANNSNTTVTINFTITNISSLSPSTYGTLIHFIGESRNITLPVVITIPVLNNLYEGIMMDTNGDGYPYAALGDVFYYAYYNNNSGNTKFTINWSDNNDDFDMFVYNDAWSLLGVSQTLANPETVTTTTGAVLQWVRIHGYEFTGNTYFTLNITDISNDKPIINLLDENNDTIFETPILNTSILYINVTDNDTTTITINDSRYELNKSYRNYKKYIWEANKTGIYNISITATDPYDKTTTSTVRVRIFNDTFYITDYYPRTNTINILPEQTQFFSVNTTANTTVNYTWSINNTVNASTQNLTLNATRGTWSITVNASTNGSSDTRTWTLNASYPNQAVTFNGTITNFSWDESTNKRDAINLTNYFNDNEALTYTLYNTTSITMSIRNNMVTFKSPDSYFGTETGFIVANDSTTNATSNSFSLTVNEVVEIITGGGGGGGGGGGLVATQEKFSKVIASEKEKITLSRPNEESVRELDIYLRGEVTNGRVEVKELEDHPRSVDEFQKKIYKVIEIEHTNINEGDIKEADIEFEIEKDWILENKINKNNIALYRYSLSRWKPLDTVYVKSTPTHYVYKAVSPGLSTFIMGTFIEPVETPEENNTNTTNNTNITNITNTSSEKPTVNITKDIPETNFTLHNNVTSTNIDDKNPNLRLQLIMLIVTITILIIVITFPWKRYMHHRRIHKQAQEYTKKHEHVQKPRQESKNTQNKQEYVKKIDQEEKKEKDWNDYVEKKKKEHDSKFGKSNR